MLKEEQLYEGDVYCADFRERLLEDGEISAAEAGFMKGYNEA